MKNLYLVLLFVLISAGFGCRADAQTKPVPTDVERYRLAAEYSNEFRGLSVLVMKGGKIVFEEYQNGHSAEKPWMLASGTKSFSGVMLAAAIEDKLISSFDEKVSDTITEWKSDPRKTRITIRQLLSLTSGIDAGQIGIVPTYSEAIDSAVKYDAGMRFEYGPAPFQIFGELMTRKLRPKKEGVMDYLKRRILNPIGLNVASWRTVDDQPLLPQGASLTAREWAKFGVFLKNGGKWNGKQIVNKKLLDELVVGSKVNPAYGMTFWLNKSGTDPAGRPMGGGETGSNGIADSVKDVYMAAGAGKQRLYVIPSLDMVVVRQGRVSEFDDKAFLARFLTGNTQ